MFKTLQKTLTVTDFKNVSPDISKHPVYESINEILESESNFRLTLNKQDNSNYDAYSIEAGLCAIEDNNFEAFNFNAPEISNPDFDLLPKLSPLLTGPEKLILIVENFDKVNSDNIYSFLRLFAREEIEAVIYM